MGSRRIDSEAVIFHFERFFINCEDYLIGLTVEALYGADNNVGTVGGVVSPICVCVDLERRVARAARDLLEGRFDFVITLCDRARFECRKFPGAEHVHWQFENPLTVLEQARRRRMFQSLRDQIAQRVRLFALVQVRFAIADERMQAAAI